MLRLTDVRINRIARRNVAEVLDSGQLSQGKFVQALEEKVAYVSGTAYAVAVSSATAGIQLLLAARGVQPDDEVVVPAFTFAATANAALACGARLRVVDVTDDLTLPNADWGTWSIPVHIFGQKADGSAENAIEDAAQTIGHELDEGVISFYGSKTIGAGEGGMVVTSDPDVALKIRLWRNAGSIETYEHHGWGLNYRMGELAAAVALGQMETLETALSVRKRNANRLIASLGKHPVRTFTRLESTWHIFPIEVDNRDAVQRELSALGVESKPIYPYTLGDLPHITSDDTPRARYAADHILALPVHEHLTIDDVDYIADALADCLARVT